MNIADPENILLRISKYIQILHIDIIFSELIFT